MTAKEFRIDGMKTCEEYVARANLKNAQEIPRKLNARDRLQICLALF